MTIKTYSEAGLYHKSLGKPNEDSIKVYEDEEYVFIALSDGAGSSMLAKEASEIATRVSIEYCIKHRKNFEDKQFDKIARKMIYFIQKKLDKSAKDNNTYIDNMMATLVMLIIDKKRKRYFTVHIGDGIIIQVNEKSQKVISYPENGSTSKHTYFVNSESVIKHLRISENIYNEGACSFIVATDGVYKMPLDITSIIKKITTKKIGTNFESDNLTDDITYCIVSTQ